MLSKTPTNFIGDMQNHQFDYETLDSAEQRMQSCYMVFGRPNIKLVLVLRIHVLEFDKLQIILSLIRLTLEVTRHSCFY